MTASKEEPRAMDHSDSNGDETNSCTSTTPDPEATTTVQVVHNINEKCSPNSNNEIDHVLPHEDRFNTSNSSDIHNSNSETEVNSSKSSSETKDFENNNRDTYSVIHTADVRVPDVESVYSVEINLNHGHAEAQNVEVENCKGKGQTQIEKDEHIKATDVSKSLDKGLDIISALDNDALSCDGISIKSESCMRLENQSAQSKERSEDSGVDSEFSKSEENNFNFKNNIDMPVLLNDPSMPKFFKALYEGLDVCGDSRNSLDSKPSWYSAEKCRRGQEVALKYFFGLQFAQMLSLLMVLNFPDGLTPLIFTGKSDTPFKAFKRYLSTALRVRSWYMGDLWDPNTEGHKNLKSVKAMHEHVRKSLHAAAPEEIDRNTTLSGRSGSICPSAGLWSPLHETLREDFEGTCPYPRLNQQELAKIHRNKPYVNQADMAITQFGFVGLFILYPTYFGAHSATDEDLDSFVHLWACIGYLLGIEDKFNFCCGDFETVKQRTADLINLSVKPSLRSVSHDWEHMTRCITEGISYYIDSVSFEVSLYYLCRLLGLHTPRLWAALTFRQKYTYFFVCLTLWFTARIPGILALLNYFVDVSIKHIQTASPAFIKKLEDKKYPFQESVACTHL